MAISLVISPLVLHDAGSASASIDAQPIPGTDFNTDTSGWTTSAGVTAEGPEIRINNSGNDWRYATNGAKSGRLQPQASNTFTGVLQTNLSLTSQEDTALRAAFSGTPTNSAWAHRTVTLQAGVTYKVAWNYTSTDYEPFNDGSITTLVPVSGNPTISINNSAKRWALLGFTVRPTGVYSTGSYGSTGWQIATYQVDTTGDYKLGFASFNIGDTSLSPVLIIDDGIGSVTRNGVTFGSVAPNDPTAPNISTSVSPSTQTITGTPGVAITPSGTLTASGLSGTVSFAAPSLPTGLSIDSATGVISGTPTGTSVATITITATGSTSGTATSSVVFSIRNAQAALSVTSTQGIQGTALALTVSGGSGTGSVTYAVANGTATGCSISGSNLSATSPGTCLVTATKAADSSFTAISSSQTTVTFVGVPTAPTIDSITPGTQQLTVSATAPSSNGGAAITNYMYSLDDGVTFVSFSPAQTVSPLIISNLISGTTYNVKIRAVNDAGQGVASTSVAATTSVPVVVTPAAEAVTPLVPTVTNAPAGPRRVVTQTPVIVGPQSGTAQRPAELQRAPITEVADLLKPRVMNLNPTSTPIPNSSPSAGTGLPLDTALSLVQAPDDQKRAPELATSVLRNGISQSSRIIVVRETISQVVTNDGGLLSLEAKADEGSVPVDSSGRVQMVRDNSVEAEGKGLASESEFAVYLFSDPILLGMGKTDAQGQFFVSFPVGIDLPLGEHTLQVVGINPNGEQLAVSMPVVVVENKEIALAEAVSPGAEETAQSSFGLILSLLLIGFGLLISSWFFFLLWKRRRKEAEDQVSPSLVR